jgi:hypothetical protein
MRLTKNAIAQALKRVKRDIEMKDLFRLINVPETMTSRYRYWKETYNIKPWRNRTKAERTAAIQQAQKLLGL